MKVQLRQLTLDATQWHRNGDHPFDQSVTMTVGGCAVLSDGEVVSRYHPILGPQIGQCLTCHRAHNDHGRLMTRYGLRTVCPQDWIITELDNTYSVVSPSLFEKYYVPTT